MRFKRRVQLTGSSTFTVSLPKDWAVKNNIRAGSELFIDEEGDGSLRLSAKETGDSGGEEIIDLRRYSSHREVQRIFLAAYVSGYYTVRFRGTGTIPSELRKIIVGEVDRLIGLEVVEESPNEIVVQDFFSQRELSIEKTLKRAYMIASGMQEEAMRALASGDQELAESVRKRDDEVDRLRFLILRQVSLALKNSSLLRTLGLKATDCLDYVAVSRCVEGIADNAARIAGNVRKAKNAAVIAQLGQASEEARRLHEAAFKAFFSRNLREANRVIEADHELEARLGVLAKRVQGAEDAFRLGSVMFSIFRICDYGAEIAEIVMDRGEGALGEGKALRADGAGFY
ncbi:MAG: PhoU domain-containing protein [Candidatus Micrarchaeia archaeon]